ncbi:MAG: helix-turn-helix transcriptional regulator [Bacteroidetes bacterium]|nr:helix-turn-helix transcriptional regulator [Bacteroidota bacterium]
MENSLNFNFYNILIFSGIVYGLIFCFSIILQKKHQSTTITFLILTVLSLTLSNLQYWLIDIGINKKYNIPDIVYIQFELLIIPLYYLFIKNYLQTKTSKKLLLILLIPFFLGSLYQIAVNSIVFPLEKLRSANFIVEILTISYNLILIILIFKNISLYKKANKNTHHNKIEINIKWLKHTLILGIIVCTLWVIGTHFFYSDSINSYKIYYPLWIGISILIYWIGYKGIFELQIFKERKIIRKRKSNLETNSLFGDDVSVNKSETLFKDIYQSIITQKLYLNSYLSLQTIADEFKISSGYLSQLINNNGKQNFNDLINSLRIKEAKKMLQDKNFNKYTINAIALEAGFNSKSNFYLTFKKFTGTTPLEYIKHNKSVQDI